jgi:hypothetical protein
LLDERRVTPERLRELFEDIVPHLHRYPAIEATAFRRAVESTLNRR